MSQPLFSRNVSRFRFPLRHGRDGRGTDRFVRADSVLHYDVELVEIVGH